MLCCRWGAGPCELCNVMRDTRSSKKRRPWLGAARQQLPSALHGQLAGRSALCVRTRRANITYVTELRPGQVRRRSSQTPFYLCHSLLPIRTSFIHNAERQQKAQTLRKKYSPSWVTMHRKFVRMQRSVFGVRVNLALRVCIPFTW